MGNHARFYYFIFPLRNHKIIQMMWSYLNRIKHFSKHWLSTNIFVVHAQYNFYQFSSGLININYPLQQKGLVCLLTCDHGQNLSDKARVGETNYKCLSLPSSIIIMATASSWTKQQGFNASSLFLFSRLVTFVASLLTFLL